VALMFRRRTVEALIRHFERRETALLRVIEQQNDRIMVLADKPPMNLPEPLPEPVEDDPEPSYADPEQFPDEYWGGDLTAVE
jgi:hypothetical protein